MQVFPPTTLRFKDNQRFTGQRGIVGESPPGSLAPVVLLTARLAGADGVIQQDPANDNPALSNLREDIVDGRIEGYNDNAERFLEGVPRLPNEPGIQSQTPSTFVFYGLVDTEPGSADTTVLVDLRDAGGQVAATMKLPVGTDYDEVVPKLVANTPVALMVTEDGEWILLDTLISYDDIRNIFLCP